MIDWTKVRALTFDCYGTLVDRKAGVLRDAKGALVARGGGALATDDVLWCAFEDAESSALSIPFHPYRDVLRFSLAAIGRAAGADVKDHDALVTGLASWPLFGDGGSVLEVLKSGFDIGVVCNVDTDLFVPLEDALGGNIDQVVTSEQVRTYRRSPGLLEEALMRLGLEPAECLHVGHDFDQDLAAARALGMPTMLVDREGRGARGSPDAVVRSLGELPALAGLG